MSLEGEIMDAFISLYTSASGRISRKSWWLGLVGLLAGAIVLNLVLGLVGFGIAPMVPAFDPANPQVLSEIMRKSAWGNLINLAVLGYPAYCLSIKRRQDRDNNGLDFKIYLGLQLVLALGLLSGVVGMAMTDVGGVMVPAPPTWYWLVTLIMSVLALYLLVVLGFLRGTVGTNSYGADPAGGEWAAA